MSHECPECGELCYCNGDIDDCLLNIPRDVYACTHWKICEKLDDGDEQYEEYADALQH